MPRPDHSASGAALADWSNYGSGRLPDPGPNVHEMAFNIRPSTQTGLQYQQALYMEGPSTQHRRPTVIHRSGPGIQCHVHACMRVSERLKRDTRQLTEQERRASIVTSIPMRPIIITVVNREVSRVSPIRLWVGCGATLTGLRFCIFIAPTHK